MINDYFSLAFGNLRHRGLRSWLTILGVFIGIAAVVSLISMGQGLEAAVTGQFGALSVDKLTIQNKGAGFGPPGSTVAVKLNEHDVEVIKGVSDVNLVVPRLIRVGKIEYNKVADFGYFGDIPEDKKLAEIVYESFNSKVAEGKLLEPGDKGKVLLEIVVGALPVDYGQFVSFMSGTSAEQVNNLRRREVNIRIPELFDLHT